jgi:hypothetical protein
MERVELQATPALRTGFFAGAAIMFAIWIESLVPIIENWNNPNEDGFSAVPAFWGTVTFLPLAIKTLIGGISGRGKNVKDARICLGVGAALIALIVGFKILQFYVNGPDG